MSSLTQARDGWKQMININKSRITVSRYPFTTDPITGEQVIDPDGTSTPVELYCRITHERQAIPGNLSRPTGLSTNLGRMIMCDHKNIPQDDDRFTWEGKGYQVGPVDPVYFQGGIIGYQAPLRET